MNELLDAIAFEVQRLGVSVETTFDGFSDVDDAVFVVIPHEYFSTVPRAQHPRPAQLRRTIALCVEQPGTPWFETSVKHARRARSLSSRMRHSVVEFSEQPPLWSVC